MGSIAFSRRGHRLYAALLVAALAHLPASLLAAPASASAPSVHPAVAPTILDVFPLPDTLGAPLGSAIQVRFSEPMNTTSVTVSIQPNLPVTRSWQPPDDLLTVQPDPPGFVNCTVYVVQVSGKDADEGLFLGGGGAPNPWRFMTICDRPFLLGTVPAAGAVNVLRDATVNVTYSEAMDTLVPSIQLMPTPPTMITSWDGTRTVLTARMTLQPGTTYTATASGRGVDGNALVPSIVPNPWTFTVNEAPTISSLDLSGSGCIDAGTSLTVSWDFSDDVETPTDLTFRLSFLNRSRWETILGPGRGFPSPSSYAWTLPNTDLPTRVRLDLNDSGGGATFLESSPFRIDTGPPHVLFTTPPNGTRNVSFQAVISIEFSEPMNQSSVEAAFSAIPVLPDPRFQWASGSSALSILTGGMRDRTTYRIAVAGSATDACDLGHPLGTPFTFSFSTASVPTGPPTSVRTTGGDETTLSLEWDPPTAFITDTPIPPGTEIRYLVYRSDSVDVLGTIVVDTNLTRATDRGLRPGTSYAYRVVAVVDGLPSNISSPATGRTRDSFLATPAGWISLGVVASAVAAGLFVGIRRAMRSPRPRATAPIAVAERPDIAAGLLRARRAPTADERRALESRLRDRFYGTAETGGEGTPYHVRVYRRYHDLAVALSRSPEVDEAIGRKTVAARLGALADKFRAYRVAYDSLSRAEATIESGIFRDVPEFARRALLLQYFWALEEYLRGRLRALDRAAPESAAPEARDEGPAREDPWEVRYLKDFVDLVDADRGRFVADRVRWIRVARWLRAAAAIRDQLADPSKGLPSVRRVRAAVYGGLVGCKGVFRTPPRRVASTEGSGRRT